MAGSPGFASSSVDSAFASLRPALMPLRFWRSAPTKPTTGTANNVVGDLLHTAGVLVFFAIDGRWAVSLGELDTVARGRRTAVHRVYETADGRFVTLGALESKFWSNFCEAVGRPEWISAPQRPARPMPVTQALWKASIPAA